MGDDEYKKYAYKKSRCVVLDRGEGAQPHHVTNVPPSSFIKLTKGMFIVFYYPYDSDYRNAMFVRRVDEKE